jgi:hypothetical protein
MYDATMIKTYTPHIPAGTGPTFEKVEDAIAEMVSDLYDTASYELTQKEKDKLVDIFCIVWDIGSLIDGEYEIFMDYKLVIETMPKGRLDEMPEFNGY